MLYSQKTMQNLRVVNLPIAYSRHEKTLPYFQFKGTHMELLKLANEELYAGNQTLQKCFDHAFSMGSFNGLERPETECSVKDTAHCATTLKAFMQAEAQMQTPLMRDRLKLSVIGSSFSMGRVMQGHPVQCFRRPKHKLPPKDIHINLSVSGGSSIDTVTRTMATIVKAAHEYHIAGGSISLTVHQLSHFKEPNKETGAAGIDYAFTIPLGNGNATAFASSIQIDRIILMPFARPLSGYGPQDGLYVATINNPAYYSITALVENPNDILRSLKIN